MSSRKLSVQRQRGLSLVELLVALAISMIIVIAAATFFLTSGRSRDTQEAASLLQDNARFATDLITRNIQQAGYQNYIWDSAGAGFRREVAPPSDGEPDLRGYNNSAAGTNTDHGLHDRSTNRVAGSDTLVARFQGSGVTAGDGSIIDCMGRPQPEPVSAGDRAYSIFEVRQPSGSAEPELRCKYYSTSSGVGAFSSEVIVRGVETLQFLYGVDTNGDTFVDKWLNAAEVSPTSSTTPVNDWAKVKSVRVGMVLRSPDRVSVAATTGSSTGTLAPLGSNFTQNNGDTLVVNSNDGRLRRVVTFTVNLRNAL
jgi:type IV pilus assembly protein PilW